MCFFLGGYLMVNGEWGLGWTNGMYAALALRNELFVYIDDMIGREHNRYCTRHDHDHERGHASDGCLPLWGHHQVVDVDVVYFAGRRHHHHH